MGTKNGEVDDSRYELAVVEGDGSYHPSMEAKLESKDKRPNSPSGSENSEEDAGSLLESFTSGSSGGATNVVQLCMTKVNILNYQI